MTELLLITDQFQRAIRHRSRDLQYLIYDYFMIAYLMPYMDLFGELSGVVVVGVRVGLERRPQFDYHARFTLRR